MRRWLIVVALSLGVAASGAALGSTALASSPQKVHSPVMRCDGDHDRDDVGCPTRRAKVTTVPARPVVAKPRLTG
jgi:hypothetical protein